MCYNAKSSFFTYISSLILSLALFSQGNKYDKTIAIFSLTFGHMQLVEYLMWIDQDCGRINHFATVLGHIVFMLEPLSLVVAGYLYNSLNIPKNYLILLIILSIIPLLYVIFINMKNKTQLCSKEEQSGHLEWNFVNGNTERWPLVIKLLYILILILPWIFLKDMRKGGLMFLILVSTYAYSKFNFKQWESMWCLIANFVPLVFLLLRKF